VTTDRSRCFASAVTSSATWIASSRVGVITRTEGLRRPSGIRSSIGIAKAAVLPVPVFDRTITSLPSRTGRKVATCTGVGLV